MIEATRHNKNGMVQSVPWSVGLLLSDVTSALCESPNQLIRHNQKHRSMFLNIPLQAKNVKLQRLEKSVWPSIKRLANLLESCKAS